MIAREGYDVATVKRDFQRVALWSTDEARSSYVNFMQASNAQSPLNTMPSSRILNARVRSVSPINKNTAMVRFETAQTGNGGSSSPTESWVAIIQYRYSTEPMSAEDRFINPLGFQVLSYRKNAETPPAPALYSEPPTTPIGAPIEPLQPIGSPSVLPVPSNVP